MVVGCSGNHEFHAGFQFGKSFDENVESLFGGKPPHRKNVFAGFNSYLLQEIGLFAALQGDDSIGDVNGFGLNLSRIFFKLEPVDKNDFVCCCKRNFFACSQQYFSRGFHLSCS